MNKLDLNTRTITTIQEFRQMVAQNDPMTNLAFHNMDLREVSSELLAANVKDSLFLGCLVGDSILCALQFNNYIFPKFDLPYEVYPNHLYRAEELYEHFSPGKGQADLPSFY